MEMVLLNRLALCNTDKVRDLYKRVSDKVVDVNSKLTNLDKKSPARPLKIKRVNMLLL